jgi:hypothetical protein
MAANSEHDSLRDKLWGELSALPKPVDFEAVASHALRNLPPLEAAQFLKWLDTNVGHLLGRLNGG